MIKKLLNIIFGLVAVFMPLSSAHADLWYPSANRLTPVSPSWGLKVPAITTGGGTECLQISSTGIFSAAGAGCLTTSSLSSPLGTINVSGGDIDVNQSFPFVWQADHRYDQTSVIIQSSSDSDAVNGLVLKNSEGENRPYLKFESNNGESYVGFIAPNFEASAPHFLWTLPEQDAYGVWQSSGDGFLSIAPVVLSTQVTGTLPVTNGGTGAGAITTGYNIFSGTAGVYSGDANNFWDNTNKRQGFGTNTPSYRLHVSSGDNIATYFTSSAGSTRIGINNASNTGFGLYIGDALKWSVASVNGGGAGSNPDAVLYNNQTGTNAFWLDGNNNNASFGEVAPSTTNKLSVVSPYTTSASRIAYFYGTGGTSGLEVRTNGNAQFMARSSSHANNELRFQQYSDGNAYFGTVTMSGTLSNSLYIRTSADSGTNTGSIFFSLMGTQKMAISSTGISIGSGAVTPSSYLTLGAGTATAGTAPLKYTSGTLTTTAVAGQYEYNGNHFATNSALLRMPLGGTIFDFFTDTSVGGAEADIYTTTTLANTFNGNGDKILASYSGNFVTGGTELTQLKVYFAGTAIWDSTGVAPTTGTTSWSVDVKLIRVSSTVVRYTVTLNTTGASGFVYANSGELTGLTLSGTNILKITGTSSGVGSGAGDIVGKMGYGQFLPAK